MNFRKFNLLVRRKDKSDEVEILPPNELERLPRERIPMDERARRAAAAAGSIVGGTMAGFVSGVAKHTVTPVAQSVAHGATKARQSISNFVRFVLVGAFILVLSIVGLLALIVSSSTPR
jgi:hypothetical protein